MRIVRNSQHILVLLTAGSLSWLLSPQAGAQDFAGSGKSGAFMYYPADGTAYSAVSNGNGSFQYAYNLLSTNFDTLRAGYFYGTG